MIFSIARKEFRDAWRDGRFRVAAVVVLALLGVSIYLAYQQVDRIQHEREEAAHNERHAWLEQGQKNSHSAAHYGVYVFKPVAPLGIFDRGLEPFLGTSLFLEAHKQNAATGLPAQDATAMRRFGELTAATAMQMLAPLVIVLLTFGALSGERQSGTLRQLLSLGVTPRQVVFGKAVGLGAALLVLFVPVLVVGGIALSKLSGSEAWGGGSWDGGWSRFVWIGVAYSLYLLAVLAISLTVSAISSTPRTALAILLGLWAVNTLLAPRLASDYARAQEPTPSLAEFEADRDEELTKKGLYGHHPHGEWVTKLRDETVAEFPDRRKAQAVFQGRLMLALEERQAAVWGKHSANLWDKMEAQDRNVTWAGFASPLLGLRSASMILSGTDFSHHRHFMEEAERHRLKFVHVLNQYMIDNPDKAAGHGAVAGKELWEKLPQFQYEPPSNDDALSAATSGLTVLGFWAIAACVLLVLAAPRLKPM